MGLFTSISAAVRTRNRRGSGTRASPWIIVNQAGSDRMSESLLVPGSVGSLRRGECLYYFQPLPARDLGDLHDDPIGPGDLYVRLAMTSSDVWEPELILVWGRSKEKGVIPLAMDIDPPFALSADRRKGFVSVPVPRVEPGAADLPIQRLLLVVVTYDAPYAGTDDPIWLRVQTPAGRAVYHVVTDTPQTDLEINTANIYEIPVERPFTKAELHGSEGGGVTLGILGSDKWVPKRINLFGLDEPAARPKRVVPLARLRDPGPLSVDPKEGVPAINLPVL
jgi:hypothetical protein